MDAKVFKILLRKHLPELSLHLDELGLDPGMVCGQAYILKKTLFSAFIPQTYEGTDF